MWPLEVHRRKNDRRDQRGCAGIWDWRWHWGYAELCCGRNRERTICTAVPLGRDKKAQMTKETESDTRQNCQCCRNILSIDRYYNARGCWPIRSESWTCLARCIEYINDCCYTTLAGNSRYQTIFPLSKIEEEGLEKASDPFEGTVLTEFAIRRFLQNTW